MCVRRSSSCEPRSRASTSASTDLRRLSICCVLPARKAWCESSAIVRAPCACSPGRISSRRPRPLPFTARQRLTDWSTPIPTTADAEQPVLGTVDAIAAESVASEPVAEQPIMDGETIESDEDEVDGNRIDHAEGRGVSPSPGARKRRPPVARAAKAARPVKAKAPRPRARKSTPRQ